MKKIFTLALLALFTMSITAATGFQDFNKLKREAHLQLKNASFKMGKAEKQSAPKTNAQAASNAPESIVGKSFITVYNDTKENFNGFFNVSADNDGIILEGFAEGYDVKASYDAATGTITIPTGVVVGTHSKYGDVTIHALTSESKYDDTVIKGTVSGNTVTFDKGLYGTVVYQGEQGGLIVMNNISTTEANAKMSFTVQTDNYECPLQVTKTAENTLSIVGINTMFMPGYFYNVPVTFDTTAKTAIL